MKRFPKVRFLSNRAGRSRKQTSLQRLKPGRLRYQDPARGAMNFRNSGTCIWRLIAAVFLAALSIPALGGDDSPRKFAEPQPSANLAASATPSRSTQPTTANADASPASSASGTSLEQIMEDRK